MTRTPPNAIGINILDTAQLDVGYAVELVERFDMAQVTVVDATHPKEAFNLATTLLNRRPQMDVFYRRWRESLPDERMPDMVRPDEWVRYMQDALEAGMVCAVYNEAQKSPMTPLTTFSKAIIELTAPKGWRTVHFKTATGTPIGYKGEQPDGYAESDDLWRSMAAANQPRINNGQKPLAYAAPHAYFPSWGLQSGHTDRPAEIVRRLNSEALKLDPDYIPISIGETGAQAMDAMGRISDSGAGYVGLVGSEAYAVLFGDVLVKAFLPLNAVAHLYCLGDKHPGNSQWRRFDLYNNTVFWNKLETLAADGRFRLPYWYGEGYMTTPTVAFPSDFEARAKSYMVGGTDGATRVRVSPNTASAQLTTIPPTPMVIKLIAAADLRPEEKVQETISGRVGTWLPVKIGSIQGFAFSAYLSIQPVTPSPPIVVIPPVVVPPEPVTWTIAVSVAYSGTVEEREASKEAWAGLADFLRHTSPNGQVPEVTVSES